MAPEGRHGLLPIPCGSWKPRSIANLWTASTAVVALDSKSSQPMRHAAVGSAHSDLQPLDSYPACLAPLSDGALHRHTSKAGAVCIEVLVRFCAGGDQ